MAGKALIIGGGRFGLMAVRRLSAEASPAEVLAVVEPAPGPELLELCQGLGLEVRREDGVQAVHAALAGPQPPEWILPCLPKHLLVEWLLLDLAGLEPTLLPLPDQALDGLDLAMALPGPRQAWHLSLTDTICPDDCPEPAGHCPKTGQPRGRDLHLRLAELRRPGFATAVLRSHQLAPGLGGLRFGEMLALRDLLAARAGRWLVATACRCHGVLQALSLVRPVGAGEAGEGA